MEVELFVHFAEIAGVFVGFGALISLRSANVTDVHDVVYLKSVLMLGVWVVIAALVPIAVSRYGVHGHPLWLSSALVALAIWITALVAFSRRPETRAVNRSPEPVDRFFPFVGAPLHLIVAGSLILTVVGVWPSADEARYVTSLSAAVVFGGYTLLTFVMSQKHEAGPERPDPSRDVGPRGADPEPGQDAVVERGDGVNGPRGRDGSQSRNPQDRRGGARVGRRRSAVERGGA